MVAGEVEFDVQGFVVFEPDLVTGLGFFICVPAPGLEGIVVPLAVAGFEVFVGTRAGVGNGGGIIARVRIRECFALDFWAVNYCPIIPVVGYTHDQFFFGDSFQVVLIGCGYVEKEFVFLETVYGGGGSGYVGTRCIVIIRHDNKFVDYRTKAFQIEEVHVTGGKRRDA